MQAVLLSLKAIPGLLGIGGAAATAGGAGTLAATLGTVGTIYSTLRGIRTAKVVEQTATENAQRASFTGQVTAQDADFDAAAAIAAEQEGRAFSGFASTSGSFQRMDRRNRILARRDAERIRQDASMESSQYKSQAAEARSERKGLLFQGIFDTLGGALDMKTSMISDASLTNTRTARGINRVGSLAAPPPTFRSPVYKTRVSKSRPHSERF